jgi:hypothetical protein
MCGNVWGAMSAGHRREQIEVVAERRLIAFKNEAPAIPQGP